MTTSKSADPTDKRSAEWIFSYALSNIPTHNHLNGAFHAADMHAFVPPRNLRWRIPAIFVPAKVREAVDAEAVISSIKSQTLKARRVVEETRSILDRRVLHLVHHSPDRPYDNLHASVEVKHRITPGYAPAWSYSYNAYLLATVTLDEYEQLIDKVVQRRLAPFTQLSYIHQKAKVLESNTGLVTSEMWRSLVR